MADGCVAARTEHALAAVVPADAVPLVRRLANHLEDLGDPLRLAYVVPGDHDQVPYFGCVSWPDHWIPPSLAGDAHDAALARQSHRGIH